MVQNSWDTFIFDVIAEKNQSNNKYFSQLFCYEACAIWHDKIQANNIKGLLGELDFSNLLYFMFMHNLVQLS